MYARIVKNKVTLGVAIVRMLAIGEAVAKTFSKAVSKSQIAFGSPSLMMNAFQK